MRGGLIQTHNEDHTCMMPYHVQSSMNVLIDSRNLLRLKLNRLAQELLALFLCLSRRIGNSANSRL